MASNTLQHLLARPDTWQGRDPDTDRFDGVPTGFAALNRLLRGGGWPPRGLVEWLCPLPCPPLLHLLLPLLTGSGNGARMIVNPPAQPCADTLAAAGVPLERLLILQARDRVPLLRACLEAVSSDTLDLLALWAPPGPLPRSTLRRLHLGAQQGRCLLVLVRATGATRQPSPAPLRLRFDCSSPGELTVTVHKQPGGLSHGQCRLTLLPEHLRRIPPACPTLGGLTRRPLAMRPTAPIPTPAVPVVLCPAETPL